MFCRQCGTEINPEAKFCKSCGTPVEKSPVPRGDVVEQVIPASVSPAAPIPEPEVLPQAMRGARSRIPGWAGLVVLLLAAATAGALFLYRSRPPNPVPDSEIVKSIQAKVAADPDLSKCKIDVQSQDGVVTLSGFVNKSSDRTIASRIVLQQAGVKTVVDDLILGSTISSIRNIDFRNFDYLSNCLSEQIHVSNGEWRRGSFPSFRVVKVIYGDLIGDGNQEAVVHTMANTGGNWACNEIFVFAMLRDGPKLLGRLEPSDWGKGEEDNGGDFQVNAVQIDGRWLAVTFLAGGSHAAPAWIDTAIFQWFGDHFVRARVDRKRYQAGDPRGDAPQGSRAPVIASVSQILPQATQALTITGGGFGEQPAYNGDSAYIDITDVTRNWSAGNSSGGNLVTLYVSQWTDSQIVIKGFTGAYGDGWSLAPEDVIRIKVWNAQTGAGPAVQSVTVSGQLRTIQIRSVGPISPKAWQRIVIQGSHFGTNPPFNGCTDFIRITDVTNNKGFPGTGPWGGCANPILITSWTDNEIVIEGFPAYQRGQDAFNAGDTLKVEVGNPQEPGATKPWYQLRVTPD